MTPHPDTAVRPAIGADALCLSVLGMQVFLATYATGGIRPALAREVMQTFSLAAFERAIADRQSIVLVAEVAAHLIGFAHVTLDTTHERAPAGRQSELLRLYVQEPFTGRGVGTLLLHAAETAAAARGTTVMWLTPWVHNHRALAFYAARGYADFGETWFRFEGVAHANRVVAKSVGA